MKNNNIYNCCKNYGHKEIFLSSNFGWKICLKCDLIYLSIYKDYKIIEEIKKKQFDKFEDVSEAGKAEFLAILKILQKYSQFSNLSFFDIGCGDGSFLKIAEKYFKKVQGSELNPFLKDRAKKKKLDILDNNYLEDQKLSYDVIFTRNTFEYIPDFSLSMSKLMKKLNNNGYFIWRDKFYDYYPKKYADIPFRGGFNSLPTKNAIKYHLSINQIELLVSKFYFDNSFLIIGKKNEKLKKIYKKKININKIFYNNYLICNIIFKLRKKVNIIYLSIRKLKNFFKEKKNETIC